MCYSEQRKAYVRNNREHVSARDRNNALRRRYGITQDDYERMLEEQGGACAICRATTSLRNGKPFPFHVDHDHETGKVRGLLCGPCNKALGLLGESNLAVALAYVRYYKRHHQEGD